MGSNFFEKYSAVRPGAQIISAENFVERIRDLENIAISFTGIDKAYAWYNVVMAYKNKVTINDKKVFLKMLVDAVVEKDVENAYRQIIQKYYGGRFTSVHGTDGYLEPYKDSLLSGDEKSLRLLLEAKWQKNFNDGDRIKLLAQVIYYMKKFEQVGDRLPNVILGGDENEMFTIYAPKLYRYLEKDYDWNIPPSSAYENEKLLRELEGDDNVRDIFVYRIDKNFDIDDVFDDINALKEVGEFKKLRVDEANLRKTFDEFVRLVFGGDTWLAGVKKIGATEAVSIFIKSILGHNDIYIHPNKPNTLVNGQQEIRISGAAYHAFFSRYDRQYTVKEIDTITAIADQLIEELDRRFKGDFWTPTIWADEAMKMMERDLGADFRDKYVVWDPAAGTKNLTRDYRFKNLFTSTIHQAEIDMSKLYNTEAISFQYDFLNDDVGVNPDSDPRDLKMPRELFEALKSDKPIVFYTNPPYGQATDQGTSSKAGIAENKIAQEMRKKDFGHASLELYTQFIYRVQKIARDFHLSNVFFFFFNKGFLASPAFEKFTDEMLDQFEFHDGFMINAGEFQGTSSNWGIIFSNFGIKKEQSSRQNEFKFEILKSSDHGVEKIVEHTLSRVKSKESISNWLGEIRLSKEEYNDGRYPRVLGGFNLPAGNNPGGKLKAGAIGFMHNNGMNVQYSDKYVNLNTCMNYSDHGVSVTPENFERVCVVFACRKSILPDASWINDKDVFRQPSEEFQKSSEWTEFVRDCVVYSLLHRSSYQTSLRDFEYNGELYDVKNEWFFMSTAEINDLAERYNLNDISFDARNSGERFVYKYLHNESGRRINLSEEARELLLAGEGFVRACFAKRYVTNMSHPEWHLMTWDAGYYQSYKIFTDNKDDEKIVEAYDRLNFARTRLETKIRRRVYTDGILKK